MAATDQSIQAQPASNRWLLLGGEAFYISARWLVIMLLLAISPQIIRAPVFSTEGLAHPVILILGVYGLFNLVATLALFIRQIGAVNRIAFLVDVTIISLLTYFSRSGSDLFYPLYFLPLIGAGVQTSGRRGLLLGCVATAAYSAAFIGLRLEINTGLRTDPLNIVAVALRCVALVLIPWLAGGLAERSGTVNRQSVVQAQQETRRAHSEARTYRDQTQALYEVAYTLSTTINYQRVLDVMLLECRKLVPYTSALALLSTGEPDELYVAASIGLNDSDKLLRPIVSQGPAGQALRSGDAILLDEIAQQSEFRQFAALHQCHSACLVPLRAGLKSYGMLVIASTNTGAFGDEQLGMVTALANYAIIALHNAQLVHDLREERNKLISKEEEVRHQLARDLHDGPAQALAAITMNIEFIKRLLDRDPPRVEPELDKLSILSKRTTHEIRTMLFELRPLVLETQGLDTTLRQYLERFQGTTTEIILDAEPVTVDIDTKTEGTLFNIVQESVNNALKHAQAKHIWVRLRKNGGVLETTIQDDGRGFDLKKVLASYEQRGSFGLLNIEERAKLIGGNAELHSAPGEGTTVRVIVPVN